MVVVPILSFSAVRVLSFLFQKCGGAAASCGSRRSRQGSLPAAVNGAPRARLFPFYAARVPGKVKFCAARSFFRRAMLQQVSRGKVFRASWQRAYV